MSTRSVAIDIMLKKQLTISEFSYEASKLGILVVGPGDLVTADFRTDESRYFATLDSTDHVIGGAFG